MKRFLPLLIIFSLGIITSCEEKIKIKTEREIVSVYDNGQEKLVLIYVLKNGKKILKERNLYYETGEIKVWQEVKMNGLLIVEHGYLTEFYKSGMARVDGYYHDGKKEGPFDYNDENGFFLKKEVWENGIIISMEIIVFC